MTKLCANTFASIVDVSLYLKDNFLSKVSNLSYKPKPDDVVRSSTCFFKLPVLDKFEMLEECKDVLLSKYNNIVIVDTLVIDGKEIKLKHPEFEVLSIRQVVQYSLACNKIIRNADVIIFVDYLKYDGIKKEHLVRSLNNNMFQDLCLGKKDFLIFFMG